MNTIPPNAINNSEDVNEESHVQTIPCPAGDVRHPTIPCPANSTFRRNRTILADEVLRLEQEYARALRQEEPLTKRMELWTDIVICKSLLYGLKLYSAE